MKRSNFIIFILIAIFCSNDSIAQQDKDLSKYYRVVSKFVTILNDQNNLDNIVVYRFGWKSKARYEIGLQFSNLGYADQKLKFVIKDVTSKKMVVLDKQNKSPFGTEILKASSKGAIWSGPVDNINDKFSLHVWVGDAEEVDKESMSIKDVIKK